MSTLAPKSTQPADVSSRLFQHTRRALSAGACSAILAGTMLLGGGWPSSLAYADGYVDGTGNNIYYGYKTDASYSEARFHIEVTYYDTLDNAKAGKDEGKDPLGKFVRVHYLSNCNQKDGAADDWRFRPMWWYGVPKGLQNVQNITYTRVEKLTNQRGNQPFRPAGSSQFTFTDGNGYGVVSHKTYQTPEDWKGISNFYFKDDKVLASKGWKQLLGLNGGTYDNVGNTAGQWESYQKETDGLQGIFVDWESAGQRFYDMTYVGEMTKEAWENRDKNPLRFAAGVYRFAGNWHYAVGQKHNTPKIADHIGLKYPAVTLVKDPSNLQDAEQKTVKAAIEKANEKTKYFKDFIADNGVVVNKNGSATITFKDNTTRTIPAILLVAKNEQDKDKYKPIMPARTPVANLNKLNPGEKTKVRQAIIDANGGSSPNEFLKHVKQTNNQYDFKVNEDGSVEVTYEDDSKVTIPASELVCQGATVADWAPYVVPDYIEVDDLKKLKQEEITKIVNAFDTANTGITPYDKAKTNNGNKAPVAVDPNTGNASITWEDGSNTTIPAWQFLKEKPKQNPEPSTPTSEKKTFIVEASQTLSNVNFDPFNVKESDLTANEQALSSIKGVLKKCKAKDAKDTNTAVTIKDVEFKIEDGKGVVVFHADNYEKAIYPMSVFLKQKINTQTPQTPSTETKTDTGQGEHDTFTYKVTKTEIDGDTPTASDAVKALKQFVKDNYDGVDDSDFQGMGDSIAVNTKWVPKADTKNLGPYGGKNNNAGPMLTISLGPDQGIKVNGHPWLDGDDADWDPGMQMDLITIKPDDLYVKKGNTQPSQDNTIDKLKEQAKALLKQRQDDGLTNDDLKRAGIKDPEKLSGTGEGSIDEIAKGQTAEKDLRDLIRKLTDAKKAERKYNPIPEIEVTDPENLSEADFKKAVEAFLKANYDGTDSLAVDKVPYAVPTSLKPKTDTVLMEPASDTNATGISSITYANSDFKTLIFKDKNKNQLFTVSVKYKKKAETPAPTPDALAQMKKDAKQQIDRNPNLTKEQKEDYKKQIEQAQTPDAIKEILKKAADKGKENQNDPSKKQTITDNKNGGTAKKDAEDKKQKEEEKQKEQKLQEDKKKASDKIDNLNNLTPDEKKKLKEQINGTGTGQDPDGAKTPEEVQNILDNAEAINDAKGALQNDAAKGALPFLDHGNAADDKKDQPSHADDAALNELLGTKPGLSQELKTLDDLLKKTNPAATADELNKAVTAAKQANARNEQAAKDAANKQLTEKKDALDNAYNALTEDQKKSAKEKYEAAVQAINDAKTHVDKATKPSEIKTALAGVKDETIKAANSAISDAKGKRDTSGNTNDSTDELNKEKQKQIDRITNSDLPEADKKKAIDDINAATKLGDPTAIADRALKAKKIADALKKIDEFKHLNKAQKDAFKAIINDTDAGNHTNDDGTTSDDIDDALANATATDDAMARLEKLKEIADKFAKGEKYKGLQDGDDKKKAFDDASTAAGAVLDKANGDAKNADQVNELYKDLLKAMQAIDNTVKGAGVSTDALEAEIDSDKTFKPDTTASPAKPGNPVYKTSSKAKQDAFDQALTAAETALKTAKEGNASTTPRTPEQEAQAQQAVDTALQNLQKAREELDGVNTKPLQDAVANADETHKSVKYTNASEDKRKAYDTAVEEGKALLDKLNGKTPAQPGGQGGQQPGGQGGQEQKLDTKEAKQKALDAALKKIEEAKAALDGAASTNGYPLIAVIPSGSVDNGNAQAPGTQPGNTGAAAPSTEANPAAPDASSAPSADATANANANGNASTEAGAAADSSESDDASEAAAVAPSRTKGHGKHARIAQTSDPFAVGALAAPFAALAGALSLGAAGSRKRLRSAKHLKR